MENPTIIIIDDLSLNRKILAQQCERFAPKETNVVTAEDIREASKAIADHSKSIQLVYLDLHLRHEYEGEEIIQGLIENALTPIIYLTSGSDKAMRKTLDEFGTESEEMGIKLIPFGKTASAMIIECSLFPLTKKSLTLERMQSARRIKTVT